VDAADTASASAQVREMESAVKWRFIQGLDEGKGKYGDAVPPFWG
jgi:hypothetical protein